MDWQPIETAPKDGTLILAYYPTLSGHQRYSLCYWSPWSDARGYERPEWVDQWRQIKPNASPSHWALPPEPPQS